jgi:hypothetical protein
MMHDRFQHTQSLVTNSNNNSYNDICRSGDRNRIVLGPPPPTWPPALVCFFFFWFFRSVAGCRTRRRNLRRRSGVGGAATARTKMVRRGWTTSCSLIAHTNLISSKWLAILARANHLAVPIVKNSIIKYNACTYMRSEGFNYITATNQCCLIFNVGRPTHRRLRWMAPLAGKGGHLVWRDGVTLY